MTKTDFAELKEKLTKFDVMALSAEYIECCKRRQYNGLVRIEDMVKWQHSKDSAIISELIEIIRLQSEALEFYADPFTYTENEYGEKKIDYYRTYEKGEDSLSETTTRLQKLKDGDSNG